MATLDTPLPGFSAELVQAVAHEAERDADRVVLFLQHLGIQPSRRGKEVVPVPLPRALLLGLGAALRLCAWESNGARATLSVELPAAREAIRDLMEAAVDLAQATRLEAMALELTLRVFRVWYEHFAWHGRAAWNADLILREVEEEKLVDALADFLWNNRHALEAPQGENT